MPRRRSVLAFSVVLAVTIGVSAAPPRAGSNSSLMSGATAMPVPARQPAAPEPETSLGDIDEFIEQTMKGWKVPGLAIAVVQHNKVILFKGYGYRDAEQKLPVSPKTLFAIGSITKSFTVTAMGMLVDEGKLDWDTPVRNYLPGFMLLDPLASERITPRDLVTHRSGLPRHDLLWYSSNFSRADMVERLRYLEPSKDFRSAYQYNNLMVMTAGYLVGQIARSTWEEFVRQRIFAPLGMHNTNFSVNDSQKSPDFALPYQNANDVVKRIPFHNIDQIAPAGSINSNIEDMTRYLLFQLDKGKHDGAQLLSENNANQMQTPQMVEPSSERWKEIGLPTYGLALGVSAYRGHKLVSHGGAIDGFTAYLSFLPQDSMGVITLANLSADKDPVPVILSYNVYDRLLGLDQVPWSRRFKEDEQKEKQSEEEAKKKGFTQRKPNTHPSHDVKEYAGQYENPAYGIVKIEPDKENLKLSLNLLSSPLRHFHYDVFEVPENPLDPLEKMKVTFVTDAKGEVAGLSMPLEPHVKEILFTRTPEKAMTEKTFLEALVGQYDLAGIVASVSLEGESTLVLMVPGQPKYQLVPTRGTTFDVKGLSGFSVEFRKDASGKVTEAVFYQPNGTFVARRK